MAPTISKSIFVDLKGNNSAVVGVNTSNPASGNAFKTLCCSAFSLYLAYKSEEGFTYKYKMLAGFIELYKTNSLF
jgi:hypothetical protein